jgi:hypothetical protein
MLVYINPSRVVGAQKQVCALYHSDLMTFSTADSASVEGKIFIAIELVLVYNNQ